MVGPRVHCGIAMPGQDEYCRGGLAALDQELLGRQVVQNDVLVLDREVVVPDDPQIARLSNVQLELEVEVVGVRQAERQPPHPALEAVERYDAFVIEAGLQARLGSTRRAATPDTAVPAFLHDARIHEARLVEITRGQRRVVATLPLQPPRALDASLLRVVEPERVAAPSAPFGPDVVGLRLGMTMDEAERIVRAHMPVGRALVADRAWQASAATGEIEPYTSGRLFESEGGTEVIVLYDEPPAAPGIVLGIVRQLALPKGVVPPATINGQLAQKYGPATSTDRDQLTWIEGGTEQDARNYYCVPSSNDSAVLALWRDPEGGEAAWQPTTMRYNGRTPGLGSLRGPAETARCTTALTATFDTRQNRQWDRLVLRLLDHRRYGEQLRESRRMIERGEAPIGAAEPEPAVEIRL